MDEYTTISKYDRLYGSSKASGVMTRPTTIKHTEDLTGRTETFIVQTARHEDEKGKVGDRIFIECIDENQSVTRIVLPPKVANAIASQKDILTGRRRSNASKAVAKARMERGEVPGFLKRKK